MYQFGVHFIMIFFYPRSFNALIMIFPKANIEYVEKKEYEGWV